MTGYSDQTTYRRLVVSPHSTRSSIVAAIEREAAEHQKTGKGEIIFKCNQLVDRAVIQALYAASQAGVKISLIVRGICCLRPNIPGISRAISTAALKCSSQCSIPPSAAASRPHLTCSLPTMCRAGSSRVTAPMCGSLRPDTEKLWTRRKCLPSTTDEWNSAS